MDETAIRALLDSILAPWVKELRLAPESIDENAVTLRLPYSDHLRHAGGVICGQVFMAAADTAMVVAISHVMGGFSPMTTVSLNTTFMRPVKSGDVLVTAKVKRRGRNLVFGEIDLHDEQGELAAHATTTYALINK
ncbi:phenylacetic acid degradation-related protein [Caballeronia pedi]|uniref:Phenylacetic acid degradation-related protein n=1 Tax=Caballeronia pedi TaxID=1777141 RepID=A0A158A2E5_9BURK|nr:PaaI family thioesterase [Caballeronia pedi]SAK51816.1 phenylacetic acid degradation-related protein [Caballeronia pedi]